MALNIQVIKIKKIVDNLIKYIRDDYNTKFQAGNEEDSFLYKSLNGNEDADYDFYKQGKAIFLRDQTSARNVKTSLMMSKNLHQTPHIYVREPSKANGTFNSFGGGLGHSSFVEANGSIHDEYRDTKRASYEIVVTSDNSLDTVLITEVLYSLFVGGQEALNMLFNTFTFSMKELVINNNMSTPNLYVKSIIIDTMYENNISSIIDGSEVTSIIFNSATPIN